MSAPVDVPQDGSAHLSTIPPIGAKHKMPFGLRVRSDRRIAPSSGAAAAVYARRPQKVAE